MSEPSFIFVACQCGADRALKAEVARQWPDLRAAFSRPGFVTFKLPRQHGLRDDFDLCSVFARSHGFSLGQVKGQTDEARAATASELVGSQKFDELHVWPRTETASELLTSATAALSDAQFVRAPKSEDPRPLVLDCIVVEPNEWWLGSHRATTPAAHWPGGIYPGTLPEHAVSRAYLKVAEALAWSQLPIEPSDHVAEIGCAPGGASQALLDRGLVVLGIDPALVDERVAAHPQFTQLRKRGHEVKRREFRHVRWLTADMNVAPQYTLDTVEAIVTHADVDVRGMLLTLKLLEWSLAEEIPNYVDRIRSWGYPDVRVRQLSHNRQEICVAARRKNSTRFT